MNISDYTCNCDESLDVKCPYCGNDMVVEKHTTLISQEYSSKPHQHMKKVCNRCHTVIWSYQTCVSKGWRVETCKKCDHALYDHTVSGCDICLCLVNGTLITHD